MSASIALRKRRRLRWKKGCLVQKCALISSERKSYRTRITITETLLRGKPLVIAAEAQCEGEIHLSPVSLIPLSLLLALLCRFINWSKSASFSCLSCWKERGTRDLSVCAHGRTNSGGSGVLLGFVNRSSYWRCGLVCRFSMTCSSTLAFSAAAAAAASRSRFFSSCFLSFAVCFSCCFLCCASKRRRSFSSSSRRCLLICE